MVTKVKKQVRSERYYNVIAKGYFELYKEEQYKKYWKILRNFNLKFLLESFNKKIEAIDIGFGIGLFEIFLYENDLLKYFNKLILVDFSKEMIKIGKNLLSKNVPLGNFIFHKISLLSKKFPSLGKFDISFSITVLQDINSKFWRRAIGNIWEVTKEYCIISILKRVNLQKFEKLLSDKFKIVKTIEEEKDKIYLCKPL